MELTPKRSNSRYVRPIVIGFLVSFVLLLIPTSVNAGLQDIVYKDHAYSLKSLHYDLVESVRSEITLSEDALSGLSFDNSEAIKKIDTAWKIRSMAWSSHGETNEKLKQAELYFKNKQYKNSYNSLLVTNEYLYTAKDDLHAIVNEIKKARDLEKQHQEKDRWCFFFFWCSEIKNTYGILDAKIPSLESKLADIENKLSKLETKKNSVVQSLHKSEIEQKDVEIQKLQAVREQERLAAEKQEHELQKKIRLEQEQAEREQRYLQEEIKREQFEAEMQQRQLQERIEQGQQEAERQERQLQEEIRQQEQELVLKEKARIREQARTNPVLTGLIDGTIYFYIEPIHSYYNVPGINGAIDEIAESLTRNFYGIDIRRTYSENSADIHISWIKDFGSSTLGHAIFKKYIEVGLGEDNCWRDWQAFDTNTIKKVLWHEIGHSLGYSHSNDPNNVMYKNTKQKFVVDVEHTFLLESHWSRWFSFCSVGSVQYYAESSKDADGFNAQIIPPDGDAKGFGDGKGLRYTDCGGEGFQWLRRTCNIASDSYLHFFNPEDHSIYISFKMYDKNSAPWPEMTWDYNAFQYSTSYMSYVRGLFLY